MLYLENIHCERNDRVLFTGLSLSIGSGDLIRIGGKNGTGKTTLLRILSGLNDVYDGRLVLKSHRIQAECLFLGHQPGIKLSLTPMENLRWWQALYGQSNQRHLMESLNQVGIAHEAYTPCSQLSAGQCQRVALARLWLSRSELWLLDEPFTALDSDAVRVVSEKIITHVKQKGTVIFTTHQIPEILKPVLLEVSLSDYGEKQNISVASLQGSGELL